MVEVTTFRTVTKIVLAGIIVGLDGAVEQVSGPLYLFPDLGQVNKFERCSIFFDELFKGNPVEGEVVIPQIKTFLGKVIGLLY